MIPENITKAIEKELENLFFGSVVLEVTVHDGRPKFRIIKTISMVPDKPTSGGAAQVLRA